MCFGCSRARTGGCPSLSSFIGSLPPLLHRSPSASARKWSRALLTANDVSIRVLHARTLSCPHTWPCARAWRVAKCASVSPPPSCVCQAGANFCTRALTHMHIYTVRKEVGESALFTSSESPRTGVNEGRSRTHRCMKEGKMGR